jgi:hypothetical protein
MIQDKNINIILTIFIRWITDGEIKKKKGAREREKYKYTMIVQMNILL